jgi:probable phosphoglycerate mutase
MIAATPPGQSAPASEPPGTLLVLVRHGETPTTGIVLPGRAPGLHLSDRGRDQAERVAERLAGLAIDGLYSSRWNVPARRPRRRPPAAGWKCTNMPA